MVIFCDLNSNFNRFRPRIGMDGTKFKLLRGFSREVRLERHHFLQRETEKCDETAKKLMKNVIKAAQNDRKM